jgi:mRNA-degrading endonuclease YafQ of YafQ-DinJ toxin-antitoxin module
VELHRVPGRKLLRKPVYTNQFKKDVKKIKRREKDTEIKICLALKYLNMFSN